MPNASFCWAHALSCQAGFRLVLKTGSYIWPDPWSQSLIPSMALLEHTV